MCGIAGIVRLDGKPVDCADIKRMTDAIAHRGPDGEGQWCEASVGLGHRRLAIIDLSERAAQPMHSLDGRYVITYNGEVYNFRELRRELEKSGSRFKSHSDTEVVLEAVIRWGIDSAIRRFNGMFAFAIWDRRTQNLLLGRDRYGIKPLYIWTSPRQIAFASEPKALRALPDFAPVLDAHGVAEYFTFQNILTDRTFLKDVRVFPPASWGLMSIGRESQEMQRCQYWDFDFQEPEHPVDESAYAEELRHLLAQAVDRQLVADVEVGAYLSGGLDSGSIVALAARRSPGMKTFTIGFEMDEVAEQELGFDERAAAESIARMAGTTQVEMVIGPRHVISCLPRLAHHMEEPRVGQCYPNFYAAQLASGFVKVVLAGTGGDEVLGGYPWRLPGPRMGGEAFLAWHFSLWNRVIDHDTLASLLSPLANDLGDFDARAIHRKSLATCGTAWSESPNGSASAALHFEARHFLHGLLAVDDRLSMAYGLETRLPFLDNDLVDFAMNLPLSMRFRSREETRNAEGVDLLRTGKVALRRAMRTDLGSAAVDAAKQGFSAPDSKWMAELAPELLLAATSVSEAIDPAAVVNLVDSMLLSDGAPRGRRWRTVAWSLLAASASIADIRTTSTAATSEGSTSRPSNLPPRRNQKGLA